jgi:DUF971 family protein
MGLLDKIKPSAPKARPANLRLLDDGTLFIKWDDGQESRMPARWLRARCPCAACVEEWTGKRTFGDEQVSADVKPRGLAAVGNYAIQLDWSDGHTTGIYSWDYLLKLRSEPTAQG